MKAILTAAALPLALAGFTLPMPVLADSASPLVMAQDSTSSTGDTGDTFAPAKPGDAPLSSPSLDNGPPSELDNGATSDSLRGTGSSFGGSSSTSQSLSEPPLSH